MIGKNPKTSWKESEYPIIDKTAAVAPTASVIGNVILGRLINVAPGASIRSDEGERIVIGDESNVQDNVVIHCLKGGEVIIGNKVSLAHCAVIHGPVTLGEETFVGFGAVVASSRVGPRSFIGHNATVSGVVIPEGRYVAPSTIVSTQSQADALPSVPDDLTGFNAEVIEVNCALARGYSAMEDE
jgi:carbonic anhydrase/acetyltransferase-like protein (isoleucine patch superfamily)